MLESTKTRQRSESSTFSYDLEAATEVLRCSECQSEKLQIGTDIITCQGCQTKFPLRDGRFPDFLNANDRIQLDKEIEFWNEHFGNENYADESEKSYQRWAKLMDVRPNDAVIEIGAGSGALLLRLNARVRVGLEPVESLLAPTDGFLGVMGVAERLPFRTASFDVVYFKHSLHHVVDKDQALEEAARITKPGGRLIVMEPNALHPQRRMISNPNSLFRKLKPLRKIIGPVESFQSVDEIVAVAKGIGLELKEAFHTESSYEKVSIRQRLQKIYSGALKPFVNEKFLLPNYFVVFTKPAVAKKRIGHG